MLIWIDGTFGVGKTAVAVELMKRQPKSDLIDFDELVKRVKLKNSTETFRRTKKRYPEDDPCNIDALAYELKRKIELDSKRLYIIPIALITDYCRNNLVERFKNIVKTVHIILCVSKEKMLERIELQIGRDKDLAITYYEEATSFLSENYSDAIRIDTEKMGIEETVSCVEQMIKDRR